MNELIFFGILAAFALFQLFNVLGRKVGFQSDRKPVIVAGEPNEAPVRPERLPESLKIANLDVLKARDTQFNEQVFIEKIREIYEQVVKAFHVGDLSPIKEKLAPNVFQDFELAIINRTKPNEATLSFVDVPKADIESIEVIDDKAQVRVRFLAELVFEQPQKDKEAVTEAQAVTSLKSKTIKTPEESHDPTKTHRRTAEYWTFEKSLKSGNAPWLLHSVKAAKA